jgi:hypothetical protein
MVDQKLLSVVSITPPPKEQIVARRAYHYPEQLPPDRYALPKSIQSPSPIGYRTRISLTEQEAQIAMPLLSIDPPKAFIEGDAVTEQALFEEASLAILSSRQSTNYHGQNQRSFGPAESRKIYDILKQMKGCQALENSAYTHIILSKPYRTPFTMLLTLAGHKPLLSLLSVPWRIIQKKFFNAVDIPTIGYLQDLHIGILADSFERAVALSSNGQRKALVHSLPFCGTLQKENQKQIQQLASLCLLNGKEKSEGWTVSMVVQVGYVQAQERLDFQGLARKFSANLLAFRSERIQPGVNHEPKAPAQYQQRQEMDVPEELTVMAGRAGYNAFCRWTGVDRERAKDLLLLDRVDVLTPNGKERLRKIRRALGEATDCLIRDLPLWIDLPTGKAFSKNAARGRKAFALTGQRIYITGLSKPELEKEGIDWQVAVRACGAATARASLYAEIMGCINIPEGADLLAGTCIMAGPVNQNDIGKTYYGHPDLLDESLSHRNPTSLLVWTLKAKTIADPIGNEEQLLNAKKKGALVDLRCGPHQVVQIYENAHFNPMRKIKHGENIQVNQERAFADVGNFVTDPNAVAIENNEGQSWDAAQSQRKLWT